MTTDPNPIFTTLITVGGTLAGGLIGFVGAIFTTMKSNDHAIKLQKLQFDQAKVIRDEERRRALLEELYTLSLQLEREIGTTLQIRDDIEIQPKPLLPPTLSESLNRMTVIVYLYFPSLQTPLGELAISIFNYQESYDIIYKASRTKTLYSSLPEWKENQKRIGIYKKCLLNFGEKMTKLSQEL